MMTGFAAVADLVADGGLDLQLAARLQPEFDLVAHRAGDPAILGDARDRGEAHAGGAADHLQDRGHGVESCDRRDFSLGIKLLQCWKSLQVSDQANTSRTRRFCLPFFSIWLTATLPISPVERTCVPPHG